ncbi:MAG: Holliday junction resolvase RuvX, partial [Trueperaceae bacterium]|nr:Holliday junction resolvase RuvX [Trueperaceae bacterium]
ATRLVVGLPLRAQGGDSVQTKRVRAFAAALRAHGLTVDLVDERFTTALATRQLRGGALTKGQRRDKGRVDEASAVAILETYLAQRAAAPAADAEDVARATDDGRDDPGDGA